MDPESSVGGRAAAAGSRVAHGDVLLPALMRVVIPVVLRLQCFLVYSLRQLLWRDSVQAPMPALDVA